MYHVFFNNFHKFFFQKKNNMANKTWRAQYKILKNTTILIKFIMKLFSNLPQGFCTALNLTKYSRILWDHQLNFQDYPKRC